MIIYKYPLKETYNEIELPKHSKILDVQLQYNEPVMWVMHYINMPKEVRKFRLLFIGHEYDPLLLTRLKHISTLQYHNDSLIVHVFEDTSDDIDIEIMKLNSKNK
jgi:hypothetical protein